jgi:hypothetical protein
MEDFLVGLLAVAVGGVFCFRGYLAMRVIIPIWGAFAGFLLGAGVVDAATGDGFLGNGLGWIIGLCVAFVFGLIAYLYYEVSIILGMSAIGFTIGTAVMAAIGVDWSWLIVVVGVLCGMALAIVAIVGNLPMVLLTLLTATAGATTIVTGILLWTDTLTVDDLGVGATLERVDESWWWWLIEVGLIVAGIIAQLTATERMRASLREAWVEDGGRELRQQGSSTN